MNHEPLRAAPADAARWADGKNINRRSNRVPVISVFFGIMIRMFYREHGVAHFHAEHQGQQATFTFDGKLLAGAIGSRTALRLVEEWATGHRQELETNWDRMKAGRSLERIEPLD